MRDFQAVWVPAQSEARTSHTGRCVRTEPGQILGVFKGGGRPPSSPRALAVPAKKSNPARPLALVRPARPALPPASETRDQDVGGGAARSLADAPINDC